NQFTATISSTGVYTSAELPAGVYDVTFSSASLSIPGFSGVTVADGRTISLADTVATAGGSVSGTVRRSGTNAPLSDVTVWVHDATNTARSAVTDSNGVYTIDGVTPGPHTIAAGYTGSVIQTVDGVAVASGALTSGVDFTLDPSATLSGTVAVGSAAVNGASIELLSGTAIIALTASDSSGQYTLPNIPAGTYTLSVDYWKCQTFTNDVTLTAGQTTTFNPALAHAALVSGLVKDSANHPLAGVMMALILPDGTTQDTITETDGSYSFSRLDNGHYVVMLSDGSHRHAFDVAGPSLEESFNVTLSVGYIAGRVLDANNLPATTGQIELIQGGQVVAVRPILSDGSFTIPTVVVGTYQLLASLTDQSYAIMPTVTVAAGKLTNVADIKPGTASLNVQFNDASTSQAVINGFAMLQRLDQPDQLFGEPFDVTGTGLASFTHLAPGSYLVSFRSPDLASVQRVVTVAAGNNSLSISVGAAATLSGTVHDTTGAVLPAATITAYDPAKPQAVWQTTAARDGTYAFDDLPAGTYSLLATDTRATPDGFARVNSLAVVGGAVLTQDIQLAASPISVSGVLATPSGDTPVDATIVARNAQGIVVALATAGAGGQYLLSGLTAGTYSISVSADGYNAAARFITLAAGQSRTGFNLTATWVVDPSRAGDSQSGFSQFLGNIGEAIHNAFGNLLGGEPVDTAGTLPHPQVPADCPLALAWLRERTYWEWVKNQRFDAWHQYWDGATTILRNDIGLFTINFVKFASNFLTAQASMVTGVLGELNSLRAGAIDNLMKADHIPFAQMQAMRQQIRELTDLQNSLKNMFEGGAQLPGNLISTSQATPVSAGTALLDKLTHAGEWTGTGDIVECLSLAADVGSQVSQVLSTIATLGQMFAQWNPAMASFLGKLSD
ncbi:MAG: carboxypeptidase regulatory-like domain-containing protein, partial [Tepidisphaeraceae bacterium]